MNIKATAEGRDPIRQPDQPGALAWLGSPDAIITDGDVDLVVGFVSTDDNFTGL
ncbi:Uncharacterised protein [Mycobacteroides abscessus]|nr:Uncharacterised protein [Mycobacteroides abscessus]